MDILNQILSFLQDIWINPYTKWIVFYLIYMIVFYFILQPICKKIFVTLTKKTKTNLDNELYGKTRWFLKVLWFLLWLNLIYNLYFQNILNHYYEIAYNILITIEYIFVYFMIQRFVKIILKYTVRKYSNIITKNISNLIKILLNIFVITIIVLLILSIWWVNITPLLASAGIFGLAVAMASKSIIENFLSGMILFADKSVNVWDTIILSSGITAVVEEITVRTTHLRTFDGNIVIIPNAELLNETITNKSLSEITPEKRVVVSVWISYWDDTEKAKELLKSYLLGLDWVNKDSVVVYVDGLGDWSVNITWKIMVEADKRSYLYEKHILEKVYKEFPKNWLNFPFPTYEISGLQDKTRLSG